MTQSFYCRSLFITRHGPYFTYHVNLALRKKQLVKIRLFDVAKRMGITQPKRASVATRTIARKLREMHRRFPSLPTTHLILSTESRKYPGHAHAVAFRKVGPPPFSPRLTSFLH